MRLRVLYGSKLIRSLRMNWNLEVESYSYFLWNGSEEINSAARMSLGCSSDWSVDLHFWRWPPDEHIAPIIQRPSKAVHVRLELAQLPLYLDLLRSGPVTALFSDSGATNFSLRSTVLFPPSSQERSARRSSTRERARRRTGR